VNITEYYQRDEIKEIGRAEAFCTPQGPREIGEQNLVEKPEGN
jgi:hypothetical protein